MIWGCITWYGVGTLCKVDGNVKYRDILDNHLWPVLARHFADKPYRFQDDNAPVHRARLIPPTLHKVPTPYHVMHPQIITDTFL
jgi:hypothetical protein